MTASTTAPIDLPLQPKVTRCPRCPHRLSDLSSHVFEVDEASTKPSQSQLRIVAEIVRPESRTSSTDAVSPVAPPAPVNSPHFHSQGDLSTPLEPIPVYIENDRLDHSASDVDGCTSTHTENLEELDSLSLRDEELLTKGTDPVSDVASTMADDGCSTTHIEDIEKLDCLSPVRADGDSRKLLEPGPCVEMEENAEELPCTTENLKYLTHQLDKLTFQMEKTLVSFGGCEHDVDGVRQGISGKTEGFSDGVSAQDMIAPHVKDNPQHTISAAKHIIKERFTDVVGNCQKRLPKHGDLHNEHLTRDDGTQDAPCLVAESIKDSSAREKESCEKA